jgi:hypothetical protein
MMLCGRARINGTEALETHLELKFAQQRTLRILPETSRQFVVLPIMCQVATPAEPFQIFWAVIPGDVIQMCRSALDRYFVSGGTRLSDESPFALPVQLSALFAMIVSTFPAGGTRGFVFGRVVQVP